MSNHKTSKNVYLGNDPFGSSVDYVGAKTLVIYTGSFIMYSGITEIYYRKTVGHVFTKPVQIEGTTQKLFPQ